MPWICAGDIAHAMGVIRGDQPWALCPWASPLPASRMHAAVAVWFGEVRFGGLTWRRYQHPAPSKAQIIQKLWGLCDPVMAGQSPRTAFALLQ